MMMIMMFLMLMMMMMKMMVIRKKEKATCWVPETVWRKFSLKLSLSLNSLFLFQPIPAFISLPLDSSFYISGDRSSFSDDVLVPLNHPLLRVPNLNPQKSCVMVLDHWIRSLPSLWHTFQLKEYKCTLGARIWWLAAKLTHIGESSDNLVWVQSLHISYGI